MCVFRTLLLVGLVGSGLAWDAERPAALLGTQKGVDVGRRVLRAVSRGGAGRPGGANGLEILREFRQGFDHGAARAPHEDFDTFTDTDVDPLLTSRAMLDIIVSLLAMLATISAAGAGIGGGGLLVPIYLIVMGWPTTVAVPLSNATIFGNAVTNIFINFPLRHPTADRPLVDFDLALILIPMELCGSLVGVLLNLIFPQWLTLACLFILLVFTTWRTYGKGKATWDKENVERRKVQRRNEARLAISGAAKKIVLASENVAGEEEQQIEMEVINGVDDDETRRNAAGALSLDKNVHLQVKDARGDDVMLTYGDVDAGETYYVTAGDAKRADGVDYSFLTKFETEPTAEDFQKLRVLSSTEASHKFLGQGQPQETWTTEQVLSWFQSITTGYDAACYKIYQRMMTGSDLLVISGDSALGEQELTALGVQQETDRELIIAHMRQLEDQDYMLLVYTSEEVPWGSWNRSSEWINEEEQLQDLDGDGWREDDPNHPKWNKATFVSSQSYTTVHKWDTAAVLRWISKISDFNYTLKSEVKRQDIDGRALLSLTAEDVKALGVPQLGPRLALLDRIRELDDLRVEHRRIVDSEKSIPFSTNLLVLFSAWLVLLVLSIMKGGGKSGGASPVATWQGKEQEDFCGSATFWILWWIGVPMLLLITFLAGNYLLDKHRRKVSTHFLFHEGDIRWTHKRVRFYPLIVVIAGVLAGLLGVGGAMVTGPLMLEMNMIPRVSTATSSFLIIFTTGVAAVAYVAVGTLRIDYGLWFACVGSIGAFIGLKVVGMLLKKYNRQSLVIWSLTLVFILAMAGTVAAGIIRIQTALSNDESLGFKSVCS